MRYSILKYGCPMLTDIEGFEVAKKEASSFATPTGSDFIEIRDSENTTVTIGYYDGERVHWTLDKVQTEAWRSCTFATRPPLWSAGSKLQLSSE